MAQIAVYGRRKVASLQLQQGQIGVAVIRAILALLRHVVLEHGRGFGIVSIETIQNAIDVLWPIRRIIKSDTHDGGELECVGGRFVLGLGVENGFMLFVLVFALVRKHLRAFPSALRASITKFLVPIGILQ